MKIKDKILSETSEEVKQRVKDTANKLVMKEETKCYCGHTTTCDCGPEEPKQETLEEAAEIDLTNLCYYDKRNPDCSVDDEDIEDHKKSLLKKNKTCSCDNCFYGRTELAEQLIWQSKRMYSENDMREAFKGGGKMSWTDISQETQEPYYYDFNEWFEQFKKK